MSTILPWNAIPAMIAKWKRLQPFLGVSRWAIVGLGIVAVAGGLLEAGLLGIVGKAATSVSQGQSVMTIDFGPVEWTARTFDALKVALLLGFGRVGFRLFGAWYPAKISTDASHVLRARLYERYLMTSYEAQSSESVGRVLATIGGHTNQVASASINLSEMFSSFATFFTMLAAAFILSPGVAVVVLASSAVLFIVLLPFTTMARRYADVISNLQVDLTEMLSESVRLVLEARTYHAREPFTTGAIDIMEELRTPSRRASFLRRGVPAVFQGTMFLLVVAGIMVVVAVEPQNIGSLAAVVLVLLRTAAYAQQIQTRYHAMAEIGPYLTRLIEAEESWVPELEDGRAVTQIGPIESISFDDVRYSYVEGVEVLHGITLDVRAGEAIGIVGPSGAGKSTFIQILLGLRQATTGTYRVNGLNPADIDEQEWWRQVAYVAQDSRVLTGTVAENIRFLRDGLTDEDIERAARMANIHDEIVTWDGGYGRLVGERQDAVSGGQRQRLSLARALAERPDVIVLDEPTSDLDLHSEHMIQQSLRELHGTTTLFIVSHRLSTLAVCDRVLVFADGKLEASGPPELLAETNDFFRRASELTAESSVTATTP